MTEAARLVDELTTLLYSPCLGTCITHGPDCRIVVCGACRRKADKPESVVHESDCPVYRLIRAEEANTAVIRANADEIADLEDKRDELEAKVNALTAQMESHDAQTARIAALEAENARLRAALETTALRIDTDDCQACWCAGTFVRREGAHQGACRQARKVLADAPSAASTEAD